MSVAGTSHSHGGGGTVMREEDGGGDFKEKYFELKTRLTRASHRVREMAKGGCWNNPYTHTHTHTHTHTQQCRVMQCV